MSRPDHQCSDAHWLRIVAGTDKDAGPALDRPAEPATAIGHLSTLGMVGLRLDVAASTVNSLAARAHQDPSLIGDYEQRLDELDHYRDAFAAELERVTGLPASLIARRLGL
jgi:hypothetical protein